MDRPITLDPVAYDTWLNRALAPFFPRYRVLLALAQEPAHLRGPLRNLVLSHDHRLLFLRNQKCACTQTTQLLYAYANGGEFYPGNVHRADRGILSGRYRWPEIKPVFESHAAFLFTFVRHPEARAHSAFRNSSLTRRTSRAARIRARCGRMAMTRRALIATISTSFSITSATAWRWIRSIPTATGGFRLTTSRCTTSPSI